MARYYLTTAIDYVNSRPHQGHAYEKVAADTMARYHRLIGDEVRFLIGNDEHSQNVFRKARELEDLTRSSTATGWSRNSAPCGGSSISPLGDFIQATLAPA